MESWALPLLSIVVGIAGGFIGAHIGVRVALGRLDERVKTVELELQRLRDWRHDDVSQSLTRHELDIEVLKRRRNEDMR